MSEYFTRHWTDNEAKSLPISKIAAAKQFLAPLIAAHKTGKFLDVGTGDGVHLYVLKNQLPDVARYGLDISAPALATADKHAPGSSLMHADAQAIPLKDGEMDASFSFGVLAYLPDTWQGLREMVRVTKPGGMIGIWFYPRNTSLLGKIFGIVRAIVPKLPKFFQDRVADCIVPFLSVLPTAGGLHLGNASWASCREVVLVNIAPPHLIFPTREEVVAQLEKLGCRIVSEDTARPITIWAVRP